MHSAALIIGERVDEGRHFRAVPSLLEGDVRLRQVHAARRFNGWKYLSSTRGQDSHVETMCAGSCPPKCQCNTYRCDWPCTTIPRCVRVPTLSGGEVFGLFSTECLSADKDPSSPHRDSGVRFGPRYERGNNGSCDGLLYSRRHPGFPPGGAGSAGTEPNPQHTIIKCALGETLRTPRRELLLSLSSRCL